MSTLVDFDLVVLEEVRESLKCGKPQCDAVADYACLCRLCRKTKLVCTEHLMALKRFALLALTISDGLVCRHCDNTFVEFDDGIEVIPL